MKMACTDSHVTYHAAHFQLKKSRHSQLFQLKKLRSTVTTEYSNYGVQVHGTKYTVVCQISI